MMPRILVAVADAVNGSDLRVSMLPIAHGAHTIAYLAIDFMISDLISERGPA